MYNKIAILRGINVGGKRKILMKDLKSLCSSLGLKEVTTYIQSGNIIFSNDQSNKDIESAIETAIFETYGFEVPVIVFSGEYLKQAVENNPFVNEEDVSVSQLHLTFLKRTLNNLLVNNLKEIKAQEDQFVIIDTQVYIKCQGKYHQSKYSNNFFEKHLKVGATTRNWKTVLKLLDLIKLQ